MGDFLKNAGIVGLNYMLDMSDAESGKDYGIKMQNRPVDGLELYEQGLWLDEDFVQQCDWTGMYFDACVNYYGDFTVYKGILDRINKIICKIDNDQWKPDKLVKEDKEDIKFINDKLLSNSYKAGFENIRNEVDGSEIYVNLQQNKLNAKSTSQELKQRLEGIKNFIMQPKCKEIFVMKSVIYNYINRFWDGKCFLLRANAKKDMRILFEQDFTKPFKEYIRTNHDKDKDMCIDCGRPMGNKERVSIAFMKDMADDLARKKSAFWNCKVDAFLCPACAFVYAASPLGFTLLGQRFAFMNTNSSINQLLASNSRSGKIVTEAEKKEAEEKFFQLGHKTHENALKEATELNPDDKFYMLCQEIYYHHDEQTRVIAIAPDERTAKELVSHIRKHYKNNFKEKGKYSFYLRSNDGKMIELDKGIEKQ